MSFLFSQVQCETISGVLIWYSYDLCTFVFVYFISEASKLHARCAPHQGTSIEAKHAILFVGKRLIATLLIQIAF
jgi:hypothetical protein